jgi:hypothetical protein
MIQCHPRVAGGYNIIIVIIKHYYVCWFVRFSIFFFPFLSKKKAKLTIVSAISECILIFTMRAVCRVQ